MTTNTPTDQAAEDFSRLVDIVIEVADHYTWDHGPLGDEASAILRRHPDMLLVDAVDAAQHRVAARLIRDAIASGGIPLGPYEFEPGPDRELIESALDSVGVADAEAAAFGEPARWVDVIREYAALVGGGQAAALGLGRRDGASGLDRPGNLAVECGWAYDAGYLLGAREAGRSADPRATMAAPWQARQCPDCGVWVYCAAGPFAEGDPTKTLADADHYEREHSTMTPEERQAAKAIGFPYFPWNEHPVLAVRP